MRKAIHRHSPNYLLTRIRIIMITVLLMAILFSNAFAQEDAISDYPEYEVPDGIDESIFELSTAVMQKQSNKLWTAYTSWTQQLMLCLADEDPSDFSIKRLLKNQDAVDDAMESFYSDNFGKKLSEFLYTHKAIAAEIKRAARAGDNEAHANACQQLRINKSEVIEFIRLANSLYTVAQSEKQSRPR
jgi:hypothetical protein